MTTRKHYEKIDEDDWAENGVIEWDTTDDEDGGWRQCPSCSGDSAGEPEIICDTCNGSGEVQWSNYETDSW